MTAFRQSIIALVISAACASPALADPAADIADGAAFFQKQCMVCHTIAPGDRGTLAPNLRGLAGRKAGSTDFAYSPALKSSQIVWSAQTLDRFLAAPSKLVPGTLMAVQIADDTTRKKLIAYLLSLKN